MPATRSGSGGRSSADGPDHRLAVGQHEIAAGDGLAQRLVLAASSTTLAALTTPISQALPGSTASVHRPTACPRVTGCQRDADGQAPRVATRAARASSRASAQPGVEQPAEFVRAALVVHDPGREHRPTPGIEVPGEHAVASRRSPAPACAGRRRPTLRQITGARATISGSAVSGRPGQPAQAAPIAPTGRSPPASARSNSAIGAMACWCTL